MIIDDANALKLWLEDVLKSQCEADPHVLANYVLALVKKSKPEDELKKVCQDQLKVFLLDKTESFVDNLFTSLIKKSYLLKSELTEELVEKSNHSKTENPKSESLNKKHKQSSHPSRQRSSSGSSCRSRSNSPSSNPRRVSRNYHGDKRSVSHNDRKRSLSSSRMQNQVNKIPVTNSSKGEPSSNILPVGNLIPPVFTTAPPAMPPFMPGCPIPLYPPPQIRTIPPPYVGVKPMPYSVHNNPNIISVPITENFSSNQKSNSRKPPHDSNSNVDTNRNAPSFGESMETPEPLMTTASENSSNLQFRDSRGGRGRFSAWSGRGRGRTGRAYNNSNFNQPRELMSAVLVMKIPVQLNNIGKLNEHFSKFGTITNIKIGFNNRRDSALIEYSQAYEAQAAYRSPEAILSNRFIRVHLYNPQDPVQESGAAPTVYEQSVTSSSADEQATVTAPMSPSYSGNSNSVTDKKFFGRLGGNSGADASDEFGALLERKVAIPAFSDNEEEQEESHPPIDSDELRRKMKQEEALKLREKQIQEFEERKKLKSLDAKRVTLLNQYNEDLKALFAKLNDASDVNERKTIQSAIKSMNAKMLQLHKADPIPTNPRDKLECEIKSIKVDIQAKKNAGEDVSELCNTLLNLKRQLLKLDSVSRPMKPTVVEPPVKQRKLDNRSRVLYITGHNFEEAIDLKKLLLNSKFEIDSFDMKRSDGKALAIVDFSTRHQAEMAIKAVTKFKGKPLVLSFVKPEEVCEYDEKNDFGQGDADNESIGSSPIDPLSSDAIETETF